MKEQQGPFRSLPGYAASKPLKIEPANSKRTFGDTADQAIRIMLDEAFSISSAVFIIFTCNS